MVLIILHLGGVKDSVASALGGAYESLLVVARLYAIMVAVERLVKLLLTAVRGLRQEGLELVCLLFLVAVEPLVCND